MRLLLFLLFLSLISSSAPPDQGPTYGKDFAGLDYNVTHWNSPSSMSPNHWKAAALECEALCIKDPNCCTWTYCTPEGGPNDPERCCLKNGIPTESLASTHWTGAPKGATQQCMNPPPPPYPGPSYLTPQVTNHAPCVQTPNWHDVAGALVTDDGECGGEWPGRSNTQVPLELRCAIDASGALNLNNFSTPEYIFWFYFNRNLPYDPVRPWKDLDGKWYATISADACNSTVPCAGGGALYLYTSPALRGPKADWQAVVGENRILFQSNWTVLTPYKPDSIVSNEFVTSGFFGNLPGDKRGGATRCFTNNVFNAGIGGTTGTF